MSMFSWRWWRLQTQFWTLILMITALAVPFGLSDSALLKNTFPKRANYFLSWEMTDSQASELAKWDMLILDMEHQVKNPDKLKEIRRRHPQIIILAYVTVQEIRDDVPRLAPFVPLRATLLQGIKDEWWLRTPEGRRVSWWPGTQLLNITDAASSVDGVNWSDYLSGFLAEKVLGSGLWDGLFFDNTWPGLVNKVGVNLDINGDGLAETRAEIENSYRQGMNNFFTQVRAKGGNQYLYMGIDGDYTGLNGMLFENFPQARNWSSMMIDYASFPNRSMQPPTFSALNANTNNSGNADSYQKMRYGLASALLADGYYAFDYGDRDHGQTWWFDEYDFSLGEPVGPAQLAQDGTANFQKRGLWRRDFKNGVVLVNSGETTETLELNAEFEKIKGSQDTDVNSGVIVAGVTVPPGDGLILLRPLDKLTGAVFNNGSFVRVYGSNGRQLRNGFFAYDSRWRGGLAVYSTDTFSVIADGNEIKIYNESRLFSSFRPFGNGFKGQLSLAVGDLENDAQPEIIVGMATLGTQVKVFDLSGKEKLSFYAWNKTSRVGVRVAVGNLNGVGPKEIVAGVGNGSSAIKVFNNVGKLVSAGWQAFGNGYRFGVNVACGDINADGKDEVIAGAGTGKPEIRVFDQRGKQLGPAFLGGSAKGKSGVRVASVDLDGNGTDEIVTYTNEVFTTALK